MKRLIILFVLLISCPYFSKALNEWDINQIPDSLLKDANAVIRMFTTTYSRESIEKYSVKVDFVVSVMNENGYSNGVLFVNYDNNSQISDIRENIFDAKGNLTKSVKKKEFEDFAYNNDYTIYSDDRVKGYSPSNNYYPYTIQYSYTVEFKALNGFGAWLPQKWYNVSTEKAELIIETPSEFGLKHLEINGEFDFSESNTDNKLLYKWSVSNLKAIPHDRSAPDYLDIFPAVLLSPDQISYEGTTGDFSSWSNYGKWVYELTKDRQELPLSTVEKIKALTDNCASQKEKVKAVYKYMQDKTRYVNISLGIGGYQPAFASAVDENGYGDCKALSNYTKALLNGIGIESFYTEIGSGRSRKIKYPDFPSVNQTNHIILCVPLDNDTIWLECTSQNFPFGYIGGGNSDRYCLLISEEGGKLAKTPVYPTNRNTRHSSMNITLSANGSADFQFNSEFKNYLYEDLFYLINKSKEEQKKGLLKLLEGNDLQLSIFEMKDVSDNEAIASLHVGGENRKLCIENRESAICGTKLSFSKFFY